MGIRRGRGTGSGTKTHGDSAHRNLTRCRITLDLLNAGSISGGEARARYYHDVAPSSFHKTFKRDRADLEDEGIHLVESCQGQSKDWSLDRDRTCADTSALDGLLGDGIKGDEAARVIATLMRPVATSASVMSPDLGQAVARMGRDTCAGPREAPASPPGCNEEVLATVTQGLRRHRPLLMQYQALADGRPLDRVVCPWGLFQLNGCVYLVCESRREGRDPGVRTYNLARATHAELLEEANAYEIPSDFSVSDYRLLPFEIGDDCVRARMYVTREQAPSFEKAIRKRGHLELRQGGSRIWTVTVRDVARAAAWAIEQGVTPLEPDAVVEDWERLLRLAARRKVAR